MVQKVGFPVRNAIHQTRASFTLLLMRNLVEVSLMQQHKYFSDILIRQVRQGFSGGELQVASPCPVEAVPAGSGMDLPLSKAKCWWECLWESVIKEEGKNLLGREVTTCERSTRFSKEEGGGAASEVRAEIPWQLVVQTGRSRDPPAASVGPGAGVCLHSCRVLGQAKCGCDQPVLVEGVPVQARSLE